MAYINFKEENYKLNIQLQKRKSNNDKYFSYIFKHKEKMDYSPWEKYSYKNIKDLFFGKKGNLEEKEFLVISNKDIICTRFEDCEFANVKFVNCNIIGCKFYNCKFDLSGVIFQNCIFIEEQDIKPPSLNNKINFSCEFYNCQLYCKFINCDLSYAIFQECTIENSSFEISFLKFVIMSKNKVDKITFADCDLSSFKTHKCYIIDLEFDDNYMTKFDEKTFFDKLYTLKKDKAEYEGIYMTYETLADKFKENSLNNNFGEYYYWCKRTEYKSLNLIGKIESFIYRFSCGYGERPFNALYMGITLIIIFAVIYLLIGVEIGSETVVYDLETIKSLSFDKFVKDFNETLNLSSGTFLGVGAENCKPIHRSYLIADLEMILGVVNMGVGIGTLTRKIVR